MLLTDRFITKDQIDPVIVRKELKDADEALDHYAGDPKGPEYGALVARELWAAVQLDLYGDPPPPRLRTMSELGSVWQRPIPTPASRSPKTLRPTT